MKRLGSIILMVAVATAVTAGASLADLPRRSSEESPRAKAGQAAPARKLVAPVRGTAVVEHTAPDTKFIGANVVTVFRVKNVASAPIAGFRVDENWFKGNDPIGGDSYRHARPFQVGEVIEIRLETPRNRIVGARNQYQFSHANGDIKPTPVKKLDLPKPPTN